MTMHRATDAADTMDMASLLIAAYCQHNGMPLDSLARYLQTKQQQSRAAGPQEEDRAEVAGLLGEPVPHVGDRAVRSRFAWGQEIAKETMGPEDAPERLFTEACLHGMTAALNVDIDALDSYLPPHVVELARKVAEVPRGR
ncbi:hypothetical protein [Streptomyces sp. NPDC004296]|uniref:hypothetical protein n=1 Tax=Streptomyces sp. NPDC004296 TaxID=3364697 RepID=UPI00369D1A32